MSNSHKEKDEEKRMIDTWLKVKSALYEGGLDGIDDTAKSLVNLSSILITVGFSVIGAMVGSKILELSLFSLWLSLFGFGCFMVSTILGILVIFRRPFKIEQLSLPPEISSEWERIRSIKYRYLKWAYLFFGIGVIFEIIAMISLVALG
jgi:hypothetical protein